jgi:serine/threonine protein kinase
MQYSQDRSGEYVGDYRLLRRRGRGTFGEVYQAEDRRSHRPVAVKLLKTPLTRREDLKAFLNEARSFRLQHPHIVPLLDFGLSEHDLPFLVMEDVEGGTLRDRYPKGSKVPLDMVVDLTSQIASALQYAHNQHLVHRDVKPENMLCRANGSVLLSDFGIASVAHASSSVSVYEGVGGTLPYMAPEQIEGKPRRESDQYALAVVVYEWLAGARPFQGTTPELISQHLHTPPPSLLDQVPNLPAAVEEVVFKALSKQSQERFARVDDFAAALQVASQPAVAPSTETMTTPPHVLSSSLPESTPSYLSPFSPSSTTAAASPDWSQSASNGPTQPVQEPEVTPSIPTLAASVSNGKDAAAPPTSSAELRTASQGHAEELTPPLQAAPPTSPRRRSPERVLLLVILAALLIGSGSLVYFNVRQNQATATANATATSRAQANGTSTAQAQANATATAQTNAPGRIWHAPYASNNQLFYSVAWSGTQFVAVGQHSPSGGGVSGAILTSPDGRSWTAQHSGTTQSLSAVAWSGSQFVAVGEFGAILTSPDGRSWTAQHSGTSQSLNAVAWSGSQFVAVGYSSTILTSPDGRSWTAQHSGTTQFLNDVAWSGSQFVVVGGYPFPTPTSTILTSPDGRSWTAQHSGTSSPLNDVAWSGSQFVVVGYSGTILTSPDGRSWTAQYSGTSQLLSAVAWSGSQFVVVGGSAFGGEPSVGNTTTGTILTSPDGRSWTAQHSGTSQFLYDVAWSGSQFVVVGGNIILTSP